MESKRNWKTCELLGFPAEILRLGQNRFFHRIPRPRKPQAHARDALNPPQLFVIARASTGVPENTPQKVVKNAPRGQETPHRRHRYRRRGRPVPQEQTAVGRSPPLPQNAPPWPPSDPPTSHVWLRPRQPCTPQHTGEEAGRRPAHGEPQLKTARRRHDRGARPAALVNS